MKLSISNIAWTKEQDEQVYHLMEKYQFQGMEIAPTRIFPEQPYRHLQEAREWKKTVYETYGLEVSSMQSIWFGRTENMFAAVEERNALVEYTKRAIDFAHAIECKNLVFGCPRNRCIPDASFEAVGVEFFAGLGAYACENEVVIGMEANPPIYNTNYINDTKSALQLIKQVDSKGFLLNLDVGTMICNGEQMDELLGYETKLSHVHISEPGLKPIEKRELHLELAKWLQDVNYQRFVSIEMGRQDDIAVIEAMMAYVKEIFV